MAEDDPWKLVEDGCVNLRCETERIVHHPSLNILIVVTKSCEVLIVDINTGSVLHKSHVFASGSKQVLCEYLEGSRKVLFSDGKSIGIRSDYSGIVLLDSILQPPLSKSEDLVKLELLLSEAVLLLKTFSCLEVIGVEHVAEVTHELNQKIEDSHLDIKKGNKAQKWNTICLELPHYVLKSVFGALVQELKRQNRHIPALPIASAVNERLNWLLPSSTAECSTDRILMCSEAARRKTFASWPHMDYKWALPDEMAEAGFYHQPNSTGDDRAMCFTCNVCLVCWEPADQPWEEHLRHSSNCPFVKGEYTQNVPLSVTYATSPAVSIDNPEERIDLISTTSIPDVVATASHQGYVVLWNVLKHLKKEVWFYIDVPMSVMAKFVQRFDGGAIIQADAHNTPDNHVSHAAAEHVTRSKNTRKLDLTAISVVGGPQHQTKSVSTTNRSKHIDRTTIRPCIVGGVSVMPTVLQSTQTHPEPMRVTEIDSSSIFEAVNDLISEICREASNRSHTGFTELHPLTIVKSPVVQCRKMLCLVVYDYHFYHHSDNLVSDVTGETEIVDKKFRKKLHSSSKKVVWGTATNTPVGGKHKAQNLFPELFLSKFLYEPLEEGEIPTFEPPDDLMQGLELPSSSSGVFNSSEATAENNSGSYDDISLKYSSGTEEMDTSHITSEDSPALIEVCCETGKSNVPSDMSSAECDSSLKSSNQSSPKQLQCIVLPDQFNKEDLYISGIYPTKDGNHLLVVVEAVLHDGNISQESNSSVADTHSSNKFPEWTDSNDVETDNEGPSFKICLYSKTLSSGFMESLPESPSMFSDTGRSKDIFEEASKISDKDSLKSNVIGTNYGAILVYSLNSKNDVIMVNDVPVKIKEFSSAGECPTKVLILPHSDREDMTVHSNLLDSGGRYPLGLVVLICRNGVAMVLDIASLKVLSTAVPEKKGMKFVSAAYCNNMERLCLCSNRGSLHFFVMNDEKDDDNASDGNSIVVPSSDLIQIQSSKNDPDPFRRDSLTSSDNSLIISQTALGIPELSALLELTKYDNFTPLYTATVPPCWIETVHAHKKSYLLLQQVEDFHHTRTWRLQTDATSWYEHTFEFTVPRNYCVGHVDLKFSLRCHCPELPGIEVTLLRVNRRAIKGKKDVDIGSDNESVELPGDACNKDPDEDSTTNPVLDAGPLEQLNAEILCGPLNLASCLDLTELSGRVTLTSPKLHRNKGKTFLVHMKANSASTDQSNKAHQEKAPASKKMKVEPSGQNIVERMMSCLKKDTSENKDNIKGCDWLHEVSITVRRTRQCSITNDRNQRCSMLETDTFVKKLLEIVVLAGSNKSTVAQSMALDILNWVASVRLKRRRTMHGNTEPEQLAFVQIIQDDLSSLIKNCIILAGRSVAQKCVKLIVICSEGLRNLFDSSTAAFDGYVLKAALECLPYILHCPSAGAMRWYFLLLTYILTVDGSCDVGHECVSLLQQVAHEMNSRINPYYMILKTRFDLYKTPLELDLFDAEAPPPMKSSSTPVTYAEVVSGGVISGVGITAASSSSASAASDPIDLKEILGLTAIGADKPNDDKNKPSQFRQFSSNFYLKGLLEVLPLHFKCYASSEGSKMERIITDIFSDDMPPEDPVMVDTFPQTNIATASTFGQTDNDPVFPEGIKKLKATSDEDYFDDEYLSQYVTDVLSVPIVMLPDDDPSKASLLPMHETSITSIHDSSGLVKEEGSCSDEVLESSANESGLGKGSSNGANEAAVCEVLVDDSIPDKEFRSISAVKLCSDLSFSNISMSSPLESSCDLNSSEQDSSQDKNHEALQAGESISVLPWQELLTIPPQYELVVERMHSAARRYVILDFGRNIILTDLMIPSCPQLVALFIDTWCRSERCDGRRLIISSDIGSKPLVMSDIQPPPICRYLKITAVGRLGMASTKCKIPLGSFYGHVLILPGEENFDSTKATCMTLKDIEAQLSALRVLYDDMLCHYNLSCTKLKELLTPYLTSEMPSMQHVYNYFRRTREPGTLGSREVKCIVVLSECTGFQRKLNLIQNIVQRLESARGKAPSFPEVNNIQVSLAQTSTDKLRVLTSCLLDILLHIAYELGPMPMLPVRFFKKFDQNMCEDLFLSICVREEACVQLATSALLVRMCGFQPWWGDFLAGVVSNLYSSQNMMIFPQDRVFTLLTYMGRKALGSGASFRVIINSILLVLKELMSPISGHDMNIFEAKIDTSQIEWILLFLSVCLDLKGNARFWNCMEEVTLEADSNEVSSSRWDFMQGEITIQRLAVAIQNAKKNLQQHFKDQFMSKHDAKDNFTQSARRVACIKRREARRFFRGPQALRDSVGDTDFSSLLSQSCVLPVAKELTEFILKMDFSSNIDVLLLACKVLANIVTRTYPAIALSQLMTEQQLLHMVRLAVWNDYRKVAWGGSWAFHAICCLLGEIIEAEQLHEEEVKVNSQESVDQNSNVEDQNNRECQIHSTDGEISSSHKLGDDVDAVSSDEKDAKNDELFPSVLESDASDGEDSDEEAVEVKTDESKQDPSCKPSASMSSIVSTALDYRLEYGVEIGVNVTLRKLITKGACHLSASLNAPILPPPDEAKEVPSPSQDFEQCHRQTSESVPSDTLVMLTKIFETLFVELCIPNSWTNLELILQLWLTLNKIIDSNTQDPGSFYPRMVPRICLSPAAVSGVIGALTFLPGISLQAWCLGFHCLTTLANSTFVDVGIPDPTSSWTPETVEDIENSLIGMAKIIIGDMQFLPMLLRFLSGTGVHGVQSPNVNVGPSMCRSLHNLLLRLQMRCDVVTTSSRVGNFLKERLLKLVYQLIQPSGAIASQQGPLDAQCELIDMLIHLNYFGVDLSTVTSILECTGNLIFNYMLTTEDVHCRKGPESGVNGSVCFTRFRKSQKTSDSSTKHQISWNHLICSLLKLCNSLIQTPLNNPVNVERRHPDSSESPDRTSGQVGSLTQPESSGSCQTDEHKVAEQQNSGDGNLHQGFSKVEKKIPCVADTVMQHMPTMMCLLKSLAMCKTTDVALLMGSAITAEQNVIDALGNLYKPTTVGDSVFKLLLTLSQKASSLELILKPICSFLSTGGFTGSFPLKVSVGVTQLSEPLIWYLLRVLNSNSALEEFNRMGGIKVLCENLVRSNRVLISTHPGLVSTLIHHFSIVPQHLALHAVKGGAPEFTDGLMNFAPLGSIIASNPTAQCPDVLIHAAPPHRRARTPTWTYHFYEGEKWMHLKVTLPCAVLLKEIHLQPHLTSLATCPSAVAVEVLRDGNSGFVPLCGPIPTSGLTFIRIQFQPEVVVSILLRLHKPCDSNTIGLTQLKLLGLTTFGETFSKQSAVEVPQEDSYSRSGLGWLRLLHHCIRFPEAKSDLAVSQLAAAAEVEGLLESCLGMLLISTPSASAFMPKLEYLLLKLGHHSKDLGNKEVDLLLHRAPAIFLQGSWPVGKPEVYTSPAVDAVAHLLFELCTPQGEAVGDRVTNLLTWLHEKALSASQCASSSVSLWYPPAAVIHSISSILWWGKECGIDCDLPGLITTDLFSNLYKWTGILPAQSLLKRAIDRVLCSMCHIKPEYFPVMLEWMGVLVTETTHQSASVSDNRKDHDPQQLLASISDDSKELVVGGEQATVKEWYDIFVVQDLHRLELSENQLTTIALVCQSYDAVRVLLDSGFPSVLTQCIVEFCQREEHILGQSVSNGSSDDKMSVSSDSESSMTDTDKANGQENNNMTSEDFQDNHSLIRADGVAWILDFFTEVCDETMMRNWMGSAEGSIFWSPLLTLLCSRSSSSFDHCKNRSIRSELNSASYSELETKIVKFLSKCCWCHPSNQFLLSEVLCKVIGEQSQLKQDSPHLHGMSGFMRQLVLHLLLENEKVFVFLISSCRLGQWYDAWPVSIPNHPQYGAGHNQQVLYASTETTVEEIKKNITTNASLSAASVEALVPGLPAFELRLYHSMSPGTPLPDQLKLSQVLATIEGEGEITSTRCITFTMAKHAKHVVTEDTGISIRREVEELLATPELSTPIQIFSQCGGLALLAQYLPMGYPDMLSSPNESSMNLNEKAEDEDDDASSDSALQDPASQPVGAIGVALSASAMSNLPIPRHSLAGFACFLRLPGYAEILLKDQRKAKYLLRLALGFTYDEIGGYMYNAVDTLHTLPFHVLRQLFERTPLTTDDGVLLRRTVIDIGAMHLIFHSLSIFSHQSNKSKLSGVHHELGTPQNPDTAGQNIPSSFDDKSHLYWAKGTGFSTGSTAQYWDVEEALLRQRNEDEHVTVLLQVISSYIYPEDSGVPCSDSENSSVSHPLPSSFYNMMLNSCVLPALTAYLRNDSVLDMSRHVPLYLAVLELVRAIAVSPQLVSLLLPEQRMHGQEQTDDTSLVKLLKRMKDCINIYAARVKIDVSEGPKQLAYSNEDEDLINQNKQIMEQDEGLAVLIADVQNTALVVEDATRKVVLENRSLSPTIGSTPCDIEFPMRRSTEEIYLAVMKELQFDTFEMITENPEGGYQFVVAYHYESEVRAAGERNHPSRMKRLAQEAVTLSTSLPLSYSSSVFVRCDTDRLDIMKVLITGPAETPYSNGCFEFDVYFPPDYPNSPMLINFRTTGRRSVRFNPNLYTDGRVCLSVLNTWHGRPEERWNAQTSSFLQVLVSIQSLILVQEPYFNEPGYERSRGTTSGYLNSREYDANIYRSTARWAMLEQIRRPCPCFRKVIQTHFWLKQKEILHQLEQWIDIMKEKTTESRTDQAISFHRLALERHLQELKREFRLLEPVEGYEDVEESSCENPDDSVSSCENPDVGVTSDSSQNNNECPVMNSSSSNVDKEKEGKCSSSDSDTDIQKEENVSDVYESL